jgi:hypothetical protein
MNSSLWSRQRAAGLLAQVEHHEEFLVKMLCTQDPEEKFLEKDLLVF